jgi:drug/metabolite transporter (DMT)-like permease
MSAQRKRPIASILILGSPVQAPSYRFLLGGWTATGVQEWTLVALLGLIIVAVSTGTVKACQAGPAAVTGTCDYSYLVFAALWSFGLFGQAPNRVTLAGMLLIALAGWLVAGRRDLATSRRAIPG